MLVAGIALMALGSFGVGAAVMLELKTGAKVWEIMMKVFPWIMGIGAIVLGIGL